MPELSVQLYTVRTALSADFDQTLAALAGFGLSSVEPFNLLGSIPELTVGLAAHSLSAPTTHASLVGADQDATFAAAAELPIGTVIEPHVDPARWQQADDVAAIAVELNDAAKRAADYGLRIGYHNHHFELVSMISGTHALEVFADQLDPAVVLEVDTYWAYAGSADVPDLLRRLGNRVVALHIKDGDGSLDPTKQVPVGAGMLPIPEILAAAPDALRVIELDDSKHDLLDAVRLSYEYLSGLTV